MLPKFSCLFCLCLFIGAIVVADAQSGGTCPTNEEIVDCSKPKWCNTCGIRGNCKLTECKKGCDCKKGYFRDESGYCIHQSGCPVYDDVQCPPNEEVTDCPTPCSACKYQYRSGCPIKVRCERGCDCKQGYARDNDQNCVLKEQCPKESCGENEVFSTCQNPCNDCRIQGKCNFLVCNPGCDCVPDYHRDRSFTCIPRSLCPKKNN